MTVALSDPQVRDRRWWWPRHGLRLTVGYDRWRNQANVWLDPEAVKAPALALLEALPVEQARDMIAAVASASMDVDGLLAEIFPSAEGSQS